MLKKLVLTNIKALLIVATLLSPIALTATPSVYALDSKAAACEGIGLAGSDGCCPSGATSCAGSTAESKVSSLVGTIVTVLSVIVGIAAVIMIIIAGFKYVTSGGDSNAVASAKNTLIYAVVGIVIVALAQFIVRYVLVNIA